jgi:hypothetical protein
MSLGMTRRPVLPRQGTENGNIGSQGITGHKRSDLSATISEANPETGSTVNRPARMAAGQLRVRRLLPEPT